MRFECNSCHAKYKISDAKVVGRVVRFPCRKCDNKILIDGRRDDVTVPAGAAYGYEEVTRRSEPAPFGHEAATARQRRPASAVRRRHSSVPPRRPASVSRHASSLPAAASSALVGQHPGLALPVPAKPKKAGGLPGRPDQSLWHVSVNDVPIGPIRLEELAHKVDAGAVSEYSLVWRDGFDDWRPLAAVPELMSLLYERRSSGPPARSQFSSMPPFVEAQTAIKETPEPPSVPSPPKPPVHALGRPPSNAPVEFLPLADALQPESALPAALGAMSQPAAQLSPEPDFHSAPPAGAFSGFPQAPDEPVSVPVVPPQPIVADPRTGSSPWVWALMLAVAVFSGVVGVLAFDKYGDALLEKVFASPSASVQQAPKVVPTVDEVAPVEDVAAAEPADEIEEAEAAGDSETLEEGAALEETAMVEGEAEPTEDGASEVGETDAAPVVEPVKPVKTGPAVRPAKARRRARPKATPSAQRGSTTGIKKLDGDSLSAEEQKLLADFGSSGSAGVAKIDVADSGSSKSKRDPLDSKAVSATVTTNKPRLQRCYERAIRGQQSPTAVRMNVSLNVAASGRVAEVAVTGSGPGGLQECMEASIRRWRFPASSEGGPAKFPIVFSAN